MKKKGYSGPRREGGDNFDQNTLYACIKISWNKNIIQKKLTITCIIAMDQCACVYIYVHILYVCI